MDRGAAVVGGIAAGTAGAYLLAAPAVVNGDGLGYLKAALEGTLYPGHLAYVPLVMAARRIAGAGPRAVDGLIAARVVSALAAALAVAALGSVARRIHGGAQAGAIAALGLAASWGCLSAGSDVESYAPALAALCGALYCVTRARRGELVDGKWALLAGAGAGAAVLLHVENLLFLAPLALLARRRAPIALAVALAIVGGAYAIVLPAHGAAWLRGASHGLPYPLRAATPAIALYGACQALGYSPDPYEASWTRVLACFAAGAAALIAMAWLARGRPAALGRAATVAWLAPFAAVGCAFYASDAERWTFLLPLAWLAVAGTRRPRAAFALVAALAAANAATWLPTARDATPRRRAAAAAAHLRDGDLVIGPGHGWDEYIGFYEGPRITPFPLVYYAGALGTARLATAIAAAVERAPRVFVARFDDEDPLGWKELRLMGITRDDARALVARGRLVDVGDGLHQLVR